MDNINSNPKKIKALVVDDDQMLLHLLTSYLKKLNFEGNTAINGEEAVKLARNNRYDICFMDIQMPVMDGIEATRIIKSEIAKKMPIVAVTSLENFTYDKSIEVGMDDYLGKPVSLEQLKEVIYKHCKNAV